MGFGLEAFVLAVFLISIFINISFWICLFSRLLLHRPARRSTDQSLTILVVFKNAAQYIESCLTSLLSQNGIQQIILVNDFSNDGSVAYAEGIRDPKLTLYHATTDMPGKKAALQEGIQQVESALILLTDIDCHAASNHWAQKIGSCFDVDTDIVLGYSPVNPTDGFLNLFIRFETWMTAVQYMSYALAKIPYMGVGRNLAYRRSITTDFTPDLSILSGDDDLFVSAKATADNTKICLDPDTFMFTEAKDSYAAYVKQKRRHISASHRYKLLHKLLLSLFSFSQMCIIPVAVILLSIGSAQRQILILFALYLFLKWLFAYPLLKRFKEDKLFIYFPILDICFTLYYWIMTFTSFTSNKNWN